MSAVVIKAVIELETQVKSLIDRCKFFKFKQKKYQIIVIFYKLLIDLKTNVTVCAIIGLV